MLTFTRLKKLSRINQLRRFYIFMDNKWKLIYYDKALQAQLLNLPSGILSRYLHIADMLLKYGPELEIDYLEPINGKFFAINIENGKKMTRIYCSKLVKWRIAVLHCCETDLKENNMETIIIVKEKLKEVE